MKKYLAFFLGAFLVPGIGFAVEQLPSPPTLFK